MLQQGLILTGLSPSTLLRWYLGMDAFGMCITGVLIKTAGAVCNNALWLAGIGLDRCFKPWSFVFCNFCLILFNCNIHKHDLMLQQDFRNKHTIFSVNIDY